MGAPGKMATGFKKLVLVPALKEQKLSVREATAVIAAVFNSIKDALGRHERVELPIGTFTVMQNPAERRAWKFRNVAVYYANRYRVDFLASSELNLAAVAAPPSPPPAKRKKREKKPVNSDMAISAELIVDFIRRNVPPGM